MAHFAEIDENGIVLRVVVVPDEEEKRGQQFLAEDLMLGGTWMQTSYNGTIRRRFAGIGDRYDARLDAFISPQPFASWSLDESTLDWKPPFPAPADGKEYAWVEPAGWKEVSK